MRKGTESRPPEREFLIAYHIKELREKKFPGRGGPQKCAEALSVSKYQFYNWENGTRTPRPGNLKKMAEFFGVKLDYFAIVPKDWNVIHRKMLDKWHERTGIERNHDENMEGTADNESGAEVAASTLPTEQQAVDSMEQMNSIIKLLMKKQVMVENGQMDPKKFIKALEELHNYTRFRLQD
ncbi:MAG: helix-turn-helix transcriptional regulator [Planctomycetota bacterium]|nr:helix-turn-helix transcriptional regulator [Planctomycetota bacterium]